MRSLFKRVLSSRIGCLLLIINLCFVQYYFTHLNISPEFDATKHTLSDMDLSGSFIAGRFLNFHSGLLEPLAYLNMLPLLISLFFIDVLALICPNLDVHTASWIHAGLILMFTSAQWLLVGHTFEKWIELIKA